MFPAIVNDRYQVFDINTKTENEELCNFFIFFGILSAHNISALFYDAYKNTSLQVTQV